MVYRQGAILLIGRRRSGCFPWRCPHGRRSAGQSAGRVWKKRGKRRRETRRKTGRGSNKERTIKRSSWMTWRWNDASIQTLEPCNEYTHNSEVWSAWEKWRVKCICLHTPSVTVDRYRLWTAPIVTKSWLNFFLWAHFQFHSDLSHHDVLEEGCHLLHCSGEMGFSTCSPDSCWRRFLKETAPRKSGRSLIGLFLPDLFKVRYLYP